jgi:hypothetical protein
MECPAIVPFFFCCQSGRFRDGPEESYQKRVKSQALKQIFVRFEARGFKPQRLLRHPIIRRRGELSIGSAFDSSEQRL